MPIVLDDGRYDMYPLGMDHAQIIDLWPKLSDFALDIGVAYGTAKAMRRRRSIPPEYWPRVVAASAGRNIPGITTDRLLVARSSRRVASDGAAA